eukprot:1132159-Prymnesium_polylepis.1
MPWSTFASSSPTKRPSEAAEHLQAKLASYPKKSVEEVSAESHRRQEQAEVQRAARAAEEASRLAKEREKAERVRERLEAEVAAQAELTQRKQDAAEGNRAARAAEEASRLAKEREKAERVRLAKGHDERTGPPASPQEPRKAKAAQEGAAAEELTWSEQNVLQIDAA